MNQTISASGIATTPPNLQTGAVRFFGGTVEFPTYVLTYAVPADGVVMWQPSHALSLCLVRSPSGTGKSTWVASLDDWLRGIRRRSEKLSFVAQGGADSSRNAVALIPQNPPIVKHWRVRDLVPEPCAYLTALLTPDVLTKRVGELSGGQIRRLYTASSLAKLAESPAEQCFLLLDETFDGLGVDEAADRLKRIADVWKGKPLFVLLVTHLDADQLSASSAASSRLEMSIQRPGDRAGTVLVRNW